MKTILITGITGGIGSAVAKGFVGDYTVIGVNTTKCDVRNRDKVFKFVSSIKKIDVLINCAGIGNFSYIENLSVDVIKDIYEVNTFGIINFCQAVLPLMKKQKQGYIINIGSLRGVYPFEGKAAYAISKASVIMFSKILAKEVKKYGIKVTCINPGFVYTDFIKTRIKKEGLTVNDTLTPEDISNTIQYLLKLSIGAFVSEINLGEIYN